MKCVSLRALFCGSEKIADTRCSFGKCHNCIYSFIHSLFMLVGIGFGVIMDVECLLKETLLNWQNCQ